MIRRILLILIIMGLGFVVYRFVDPMGADQLVENIQTTVDGWFSDDVQEDITNNIVVTGTVLHIDNGDITDLIKEKPTNTITGDNDEIMEDMLLDEDNIMLDTEDTKEDTVDAIDTGLLDSIVTGEKDKTITEIIDDDNTTMNTGDDKIEEKENIQENVYKQDQEEDNGLIDETDEESEEVTSCGGEGDIVILKDKLCCSELNWIEYRPGQKDTAGVICFDIQNGIPSCKFVDTEKEGWYYMDGTLLRKDLECGNYFGTKTITYITNINSVENDVDQTDMILENIVN